MRTLTITMRAGVTFLRRVVSQRMATQRPTIGEGLTTFLADERTFPSMDPHVGPQICEAGERFETDFTTIWPLPSMDPHVDGHVVLTSELFGTYRTGMRFFATVGLHVAVPGGTGVEAHITNEALVIALVSVSKHVSRESSFASKSFIT